MANCCLTEIKIFHKEEPLKQFYELLDEWTNKDYFGQGSDWLGNIVLMSEIGTVNTGKDTDVKCRGVLCYKDLCGDRLDLSTETAWTPMLQMWLKLIDKYLPGAKLFYKAEECGCKIQNTNDPELIEKYAIDSWDIDSVEPNSEASEETVKEVLQLLLNTEEPDIQKLIQMLEESEYSDGMAIRKWEYLSAKSWD